MANQAQATQAKKSLANPPRSNEPIFWGLFGAGGMVAAILLPVLILITGIWQPQSFTSYDVMLAFAQNWFGKLVILAAVIFPLWNGVHRMLHGLHDLGIHLDHSLGQKLFYGFAAVMSLICFVLVLAV